MSTNRELADRFERMAAVLEVLGANRFRVAAFARGARVLKDLPQDVADLAGDVKNLTALDGIGKGLAAMIVEYVNTGKIEEIESAAAEVPPGVLALLDIPGLGPKSVSTLWKQAGIQTAEDLKTQLETGELEALPRMGAKTLENLKRAVAFAESAGARRPIGIARPVAEAIVKAMRALKGVKRCDYAGSLRRGRETIGDIDILVGCADPEKHGANIGEAFRAMEGVQDVLAAGATKTSVRLEDGLQVDLRVVDDKAYGAALLYFTGSKEHNVRLRERAIEKGLRLNEYGLWRSGDTEGEPAAAKTEAAVYRKLGLQTVPPPLREDRGEVAAAAAQALPQLIEIEDVRAELHAHTTASDGKWSILELAEAAKRRGCHTVAVTDHSVSSVIANGLDVKRLLKHVKAVRKINDQLQGITVLAGSEVDILADGRLDYEDAVLAELDVVVASPHAALGQDPKKATARLLRAIENPHVHIIGHPTGRMIGQRPGLEPDMAKLFAAAAETGTALEINANRWRLDLRDTHARAAVEAGVKLSINTDAHALSHFDELPFGILTAQRAWVRPADVVNCLTAAKLRKWLQAKRIKMGV